LLCLATPSNPLFKITHIHPLPTLPNEHNILLPLHNTFITPFPQSPLPLPPDILIHTATEFLRPRNDLIAGAPITNNTQLPNAFYLLHNATATPLSAYDT
ncbi:PLP-dependent transferase, partial [Staphylococcus epidermidis]|uniref:PLP-dependent transferase n=1 Tax=Staphylococcus epidermidis TaxID=1282 RepID=UPI0016435DBA